LKETVFITNHPSGDISYLLNYDASIILKGLNLIEIHDIEKARQIAGFLKLRARNDIFILSKERKVIKEMYSVHPYARYVYEPKKTFDDINKFTKELFSLGIFTICLDISYANQRVIRELKKCGIVVIIRAETQLEAYEALLSGADGILGKNIEKIKMDPFFYTRPILVSHRGYQVNNIENSLGAAIDAEKLGAEFIELDIHVTKNNVVVVNHGASLFKSSLFSFFTVASAVSFMVFNLYSAPCFAAIGAMRQELGSAKKALYAVLFQTLMAYVLAAGIFWILKLGGL
jgi:hypothetical protein